MSSLDFEKREDPKESKSGSSRGKDDSKSKSGSLRGKEEDPKESKSGSSRGKDDSKSGSLRGKEGKEGVPDSGDLADGEAPAADSSLGIPRNTSVETMSVSLFFLFGFLVSLCLFEAEEFHYRAKHFPICSCSQ